MDQGRTPGRMYTKRPEYSGTLGRRIFRSVGSSRFERALGWAWGWLEHNLSAECSGDLKMANLRNLLCYVGPETPQVARDGWKEYIERLHKINQRFGECVKVGRGKGW
jgi:hypothetical protein